ncbi:MAG: PAS domain S-box protein [Actinomycetes bacterium]
MVTRPSEGGVVACRLRLEPLPESARRARQLLAEVLDQAGRHDLVDAASLLVSELVTNAVLHARTAIDLRVAASPTGVHVGVTDHSPLLPQRRGYGRSATTGRGLGMVDMVAERSGTEPEPDGGKTVWFELGSIDSAAPDRPSAGTPPPAEPIGVDLLGTPLRLARAWQQHADALLREYLLACWELAGDVEERLAEQAAAGAAFAEIAAVLDGAAAAGEEHADLSLRLPAGQEPAFNTLDRLLDQVAAMAERGELLAPPAQPEIRMLRRWFCSQIAGQLTGAAPSPWVGLVAETVAATGRPVAWDATAVRASRAATIAADDSNRILAVSGAVRDLLGWSEDELVGRRIVRIIPAAMREHHVAAFTLHLLTGRTSILDRHVQVAALCHDGSERVVDLLVRRERAGAGHAVFVATLRPVD